MQNLPQRSLQLQLRLEILNQQGRAPQGGMTTKSSVHLLDGAVLLGDLIAAEFPARIESVSALGVVSFVHGLLRIAVNAVETSVYSSFATINASETTCWRELLAISVVDTDLECQSSRPRLVKIGSKLLRKGA